MTSNPKLPIKFQRLFDEQFFLLELAMSARKSIIFFIKFSVNLPFARRHKTRKFPILITFSLSRFGKIEGISFVTHSEQSDSVGFLMSHNLIKSRFSTDSKAKQIAFVHFDLKSNLNLWSSSEWKWKLSHFSWNDQSEELKLTNPIYSCALTLESIRPAWHSRQIAHEDVEQVANRSW